MHHILTLETLIQYQTTQGQSLHAVFIDLQKAFDSVNREQLLDLMHKYEFPTAT
jgi:hypothetical protein